MMTPLRRALRIALIYLLLGTLWILTTDVYLESLDLGQETLVWYQLIKGFVFVVVTGVVFFLLAYRELKRQYEADMAANRRHTALQALYEATFDHAAVGLAHTTREGRFLRVNKACCDMLGYPREELVALSCQDLVHPDDREPGIEPRRQLTYGSSDSFSLDKRFLRRDGSTIWVTLTASRVPDPSGEAEYYLAVINDVSDRKQMEDALRTSESRFRALVEQSITGIYVFDAGAFRYVNSRLAEMFGYTEDELVNRRRPHDLIVPEDQDTLGTQIQRRLEGTAQSAHYTARGLRKDGSRFWLELYGSRMELDGQPAITGTALDITERVEAEHRLRESEARLRAIYEGVNDAILIMDPAGGTIIDMNHRALEISGYDAESMRQLRVGDLGFGESDNAEKSAVERVRDALRGRPQIFEWQVRTRDGRGIWVEVNMRVARVDGVPRMLVLARDISERRESEAKLRLTSQVFNSTREGVVITDTDSRIVSVNPAFTEITGYTESEVLGRTPKLLQSGLHDRSFYQSMWQSIERSDHWQGELWNRRKSGETYPEWLTISTVRNEQGVITNYVGVFSDISRVKHSEAEVQRLAHYDALTGLPNRILLMTRLEHALDICKRRGHRAVVLCCGLDRFKQINDSLGYMAGDELLQVVSRRIRGRLQRGDTIARFSGDEFVVLREAPMDEDDIAHLAESIVGLGASAVDLSDGQIVFAGISVGISMSPEDGDDPDSLVTRANTAMQQAKSEGRHTYRFYKQELTEAARARLELESRLRRAVDESQFELFYQPIVDVRSGRITGAEALLRWIEPDLGMIMPDRFIPVAEDTALILPLGRWVLETACRQSAEWSAAGHAGLRVAVNLSSRQFESGTLDEEVTQILNTACSEPDRLELEITESMLMEHGAHSMETLNSLRRAGIGVSIDDFGTGYSSLAYLKRFAISKLKIDRMFIKDLPGDHDDSEIVAAIIAMAHNLNLQVIAEGVETPGQLEFLKRLGCDEFQGYLISPPVPAAQFAALLD